MIVHKNGTIASAKGPADYFTGTVRVDGMFQAPTPARVSVAAVTFEPGARTNWHTHPYGQTLVVLSGSGLAQKEGEAIIELKPGDIIFFEPGERHWHGAAPHTAMSHMAIQEKDAVSAVTWQERVTDAQYGK